MKKEKLMKRISALVCALAFLGGGIFMSCSDSDDDASGNSGNGGKSSESEESGPVPSPSDNPSSGSDYDDSALSECTLWVVGDSTVCDYTKEDGTLTDATYFYPRYGYGTQFYNYFSTKITVKNLALSGRSSKSFLEEANYSTLKNGIKAGDFLVIGFGHNDEKSDDAERFASAKDSTDTEGSFKYNLYNYYQHINYLR